MAIKERAETEIVLSGGQTAGKTINELTAQSVKLNREIKKLEIGSDEYVKKTAEYSQINSRLKDVRSEVYSVGKAQDSLNGSMMKYMPFNSKLQSFVGTYNNVNKSVRTATVGTNMFTRAMIAIPVIALITAITSLVKWFASTQAGMDAITKVTRPLVAIWERLTGLGQDLALNLFSKIKGWVRDPVQAFKDLGNAIQDNLMNRLEALGKFAPAIARILRGELAGGFKDLGNAVLQMGLGIEDGIDKVTDGVGKFRKEMANAAEVGKQIQAMQVAIEEAEIRQIKRTEELNLEYKRQYEIARDSSKSADERQKAAQAAMDAVEEQLKMEQELIDMRIEKWKLEDTLNDTSRADQKEFAQLEAERLRFETNASQRRMRARSQLNNANKALAADTKKIQDEEVGRLKKLEDAEKSLADLRISLMTDEQERRKAEIERSFERDISAFEGTEDQKTEFVLLKEQERDRALQELADENRKAAFEKELEQLDEQSGIRKARIEESFYSGLIEKEERDRILYEQEKAAIEDRLALMVAAGKTQTLEYTKLYADLAQLHFDYESKKTEKAKKESESRSNLESQSLKVASDVFGGFADLLSQDEEARKKNWKMVKALKKAELLSNLPVEIQNIWKNANTFPVPFNMIVGGAQSALAVARFMKAQANLDTVKYRFGGPVFGPSHAAGGIPFGVAGSPVRHEMEGGEIILARGVYDNPVLRAAASMINQAGGGRSFELGGPVNPLPGHTSTIVNNVTNQLGGRDRSGELISEVRELRNDVNKWQKEFEVKLSVQKVRSEIEGVKSVELDASF